MLNHLHASQQAGMQDEVACAFGECMAMVNASALTVTQHVLATRNATQGTQHTARMLQQFITSTTAALHAAGIPVPSADACVDGTQPVSQDAVLQHVQALLGAWSDAHQGLQAGLAAREAALTDARSHVQQLQIRVTQVCTAADTTSGFTNTISCHSCRTKPRTRRGRRAP